MIIPGRDLSIQTTTTSEDSSIVHKIRIENKRLEPILALHIKPFIPQEFTAMPEEHVIDKLGPSETGILVFKLTPGVGVMPRPVAPPTLTPQIEALPMEEKIEEPLVVAVQREPTHELSPEEVEKMPPAPKKTIYECPKCKGPFVIEADEKTPVVGCPWCGVDVKIGEETATVSKEEAPQVEPTPMVPMEETVQELPPPPPPLPPPPPEMKPVEEAPVMMPVEETRVTATTEIDEKQQQNLRELFEKALTQLNNNEDYTTVMTTVYENISDHLEKFASAGKSFETFEDFKAICKKNLKIEKDILENVLNTLDDAFYGSGETEEKKKKTIELFTNVIQTLVPAMVEMKGEVSGKEEIPTFQPVEEVPEEKEKGKKKRFWGSKKKK
jgi:DNA-directed RNA polymerase subunit RPC12/RpoP